MLRFAVFSILAILVAPVALAAVPGLPNSIAVGPRGIVDPTKDPYFVWATITSPEVHQPGGSEDDCGIAGSRRPDPVGTTNGLVTPILAWDPTEHLSLHEIFPQCIATQVSAPCGSAPLCPSPLPTRAYAAYDVGTGRFYAELAIGSTGPGPALPLGMTLDPPGTQNAEQEFTVGGNSGAAMLADCETCPPPCC